MPELGSNLPTLTHLLGSDGTLADSSLGYSALLDVKTALGLNNVDNTADLDKPISSDTQTALNLKANISSLATVATSGQYSALIGIPETFTPAVHNQAWSTITSTPTTLSGYGIADAETTAQLNARDTANRARANHTGTQPASSITGLATVATSGLYSDLIGTPSAGAIGFNYDQGTIPSAPSAGQTWIERRPNGLVRAIWQWSGSLWVAFNREVYSGFHSNVSASQNGSVVNARLSNATGSTPLGSIIVERVFYHGRAGNADGANFWTIGLSSLSRLNNQIASYTELPGTSVVVNVSGEFTFSVEPNLAVSAATGLAGLATYATQTAGNPTSMGVIVTAETRRVRP